MKDVKQKRIVKTISLATFPLLFLGCFITGCSKKNGGCTNVVAMNYDKAAEEDDGSCILAGKGGFNTIIVSPQHHGVPILSSEDYHDSAYVKFNTLEFPGDNPALYDLVIKGARTEDSVRVERLKPGNYYVFVTGFDPSIGERVTGGIPVRVAQPYGVVDLIVPVTE